MVFEQSVESTEVTDLIIEEVDLLDFKIPSYDQILSAYSDGYVEKKPEYKGPERRAYPRNPKFSRPKKEDPGYSIDCEDDPLAL